MRKYEAIRVVLEEAGHPLHYTEIAERIQAKGLYQTRAKNWYKAVNTDLSKIIRVMSANGEQPWLTRVDKGTYALSEWDGKV